jgi:hypothetical protein
MQLVCFVEIVTLTTFGDQLCTIPQFRECPFDSVSLRVAVALRDADERLM